ncbi:hypothetical protein BGZ72_001672 [Mortierella alpina]|nr:hypothetical protein BGZ72_001672 [Mortierella alpina]
MSAYVPDPVWAMASSFIETHYMLVHGGCPGSSSLPIRQTFALKLDISWNTSQPIVQRLTDGSASYNFASTLSSDNRTWFMISGSIPYKFYTGNATWSQLPTSTFFTNSGGLGAATDPVSG